MRRTFSSLPRFLLLLALAIGAVFGAFSELALAQQPPSAADLAQARELLNAGLRLREKGDATAALEKLRAARALANTPITGIELGRTYLVVGKLIEAREAFLSVARIPPRSEETARSATARAESAQLAEQTRSRIPSLTVRVTGVPLESVAVTIDGDAVPVEALAGPRLLDPGTHEVVARTTSGGAAKANVDLREAESRNVELEIVLTRPAAANVSLPAAESGASADVKPLETPASNRGQVQRVTGLVLGGAGTLALGAGAVLGLLAKSQDNTAARESFPAKHDDSLAASHLADAATVVVVSGAALALTGSIVWLTAPKAQVAVATNGHEVIFMGRF